MRGLRSTLALLAALIGLSAYIYFTRDSDSSPSSENRVFASLETNSIQSITVRSEAGDATTVERTGDDWRIVSPIDAPAAAIEVSGLASTLTTLTLVRVVEETPADLAPFGLDPARVSVEFTASGETTSGGLLIGNKTTTGQDLYAKRIDEDDVFLIAAYQESSLNRSTYDLRDKSVVTVQRDQVESIDVARARPLLTLQKAEDEWRLAAPGAGRADVGMVEGLIGSVAGAEMRTVVSENPTPQELQTWGLDSSALSVALTHAGTETTLLIGNEAEEGRVYAKDASRTTVVTVDQSVADVADRPAEDYRRRDLFGFRAYTVNRIEFVRGDSTVTFERVRGEDTTPDSWRRVAPTEGEVDRGQMDLLLTGLADTRATAFVPATANTGLDSPALTVTATFEDGSQTETVRFGRQGSNVYASRTDEPDALQIDAEKLDEAIEALDGLTQASAGGSTNPS